MDATPYEWVHGQVWHLHLTIDDASGIVTGAWFNTQETLNGYYHVFEQILTDYSIPYKLLTDKRNIFTYKKKISFLMVKIPRFAYAYLLSLDSKA